ncbi:Gfo/Idh/MocA family protein [Tannockella kyphosi]|uniref:Gfo/Idh/MocA family protein n=1 Tax=Tannockella kyphosi TaxID=2899121 RepID=UPI002012F3CD|nr:Gfo/Idh/MocA family oxidoreductase [Tannockella kyphosi]
MIRYGILSTASIAKRFIDGVRESKDGCVVAIASRSVEKAQSAAKEFGIDTYYGSYVELFEDESIDIVYIPTMNELHYRDCKMALEHGKHVLMEKPFVLVEKDAKELFDLAKEKGLFLMEVQKSVFLPTTKKVKELIESDEIGEVRYIELKASFPARFTTDHWMYNLKMGGGSLYGSATYTIELLQYLFDDPTMEIDGSMIPGPNGIDEMCNFQLCINNFILVSSTITMNIALPNQAVIYGAKGYIVIPNYWKSNHCVVHYPDGSTKQYDFPYQSEFVYEIEHVHDCIKKGLLTSPIMHPNKTIETVRLVHLLQHKWHKI